MLVQSALPAYRQRLVDGLVDEFGESLSILTGESQFAKDVTLGVSAPEPSITIVRNRFLFGRRILWQSSVVRKAMGARVAIVELNPRIINTWLTLIFRRMAGRPTILWGHAWPRMGRQSRTGTIRHLQRLLADCVVVYTKRDADELREEMPENSRVASAPNAVLWRCEMGSDKLPAVYRVIYSGRLTPPKKPALLLDAFAYACQLDAAFARKARLTYIGAGELEEELHRSAESVSSMQVDFLGEIWDASRLKEIYDEAFLAVSPGYAGLSIVQSWGFGTPTLVSHHEPHAPEVGSFRAGSLGQFFRTDSVDELAKAILLYWKRRHDAAKRSNYLVRYAQSHHSIEVMASGFSAAIREVHPRTPQS